MAVSFPLGDGDDDEAVLVAINTTPLVDVMLVLLIIFLITVPAVSATIPVSLPRQDAPVSDVSAVTLTVDAEGRLYWNDMPMANTDELRARLAPLAPTRASVHLRADEMTPFSAVAAAIDACRDSGIAMVGFVTQPEGRP